MVQSQEAHSFTIGRLAAEAHVGVETVRFYQRRGLLDTPTRDGGVRRYGAQELRQLHFIKQAQTAGFTLEEIKELLALDASEDRHRAHELAKARVAALNEKIKDLTRARDALQTLARDCGAGGSGPCPILQAFGV